MSFSHVPSVRLIDPWHCTIDGENVYIENFSVTILLLIHYWLPISVFQRPERKVLRTLPWHQYQINQLWSLGRRLKDKSRKVWPPDTRRWKQTSKSRTKTKVKLSSRGKVLPVRVVNVYAGVEVQLEADGLECSDPVLCRITPRHNHWRDSQ